MASSSSGDGPSTSGGGPRCERLRYWGSVPVVEVRNTYGSHVPPRKLLVAELDVVRPREVAKKLRMMMGAGLDTAAAALANPKSNMPPEEGCTCYATDADDGADPNQAYSYGITPLYHASGQDYLLSNGDDVDPVCPNGESPQLFSARTHRNILPDDLHTPLGASIFGSLLECLQTFIEAGADVNIDSSVTPLSLAACQNLADCIKCLLNNGADPNELGGDDNLPIEIAASKGCVEWIDIVLPERNHLPKYTSESVDQIVQQQTPGQSFVRSFIRSALAFLMKERFTSKNFLVKKLLDLLRWPEHLVCQGALRLTFMLFFSKGGATKPLVSTNAGSLFNQILMHSMIRTKAIRPRNSIIVSFDGSDDEIEQSYRGGIEAFRLWCYANGKRVALPKTYGSNLEVITTPEDGTFYLTLEYKGRHLVLSFAGRDLYLMGWRSIHGTYELKLDSQEEHYMAGDSITVLDIPKNYGFLSPKGQVGQTRMGTSALQQSFEILHKCQGEVTDGLKQAVGMFAVHFAEAARFQDIFNDVCSSIRDYDVPTLDSKNSTNSYWVQNWDALARIGMKRADLMDRGEPLPPIENDDDEPVQVTSELDIFRQIRILPCDAYTEGIFGTKKEGIFKTKKRKGIFETEKRRIFEGALDDISRGTESSQKRQRRERKEKDKRKVSRSEDPSNRGDGGYPVYSLLEEWGYAGIRKNEVQKDNSKQEKELISEINDEEEAEINDEEEAEINDEEEAEINDEEERRDNNKEDTADKEKLKGKCDENESGPEEISIGDYLDHFAMVKKMIHLNSITKQSDPPVKSSWAQRPIYPVVREPFPSYGIMRPILRESTSSIGHIKSLCVTQFKQPRLPNLQSNLLRACSFMNRVLRFV